MDALPVPNARATSVGPSAADAPRSSALKVSAIVLLISFWEGFPFSAIGVSNLIGYQLYAVLMFVGAGVYLARSVSKGRRLSLWETLPIALFITCLFSSFIYSTIVNPQEVSAWLPSIYTVSPILTVFALRALGCNFSDGIKAIYWSGFLGSLILVVNNLLGLHILDFYVRGSAFQTIGRVVFFKLEATFCVVLVLMNILHTRDWRRLFGELFVLLIVSYNVFVASESRLAIVAVVLCLALSWVFVLRGDRRLLVGVIAPIVVMFMAWFVFGKYFQNFAGIDQYLQQDVSASFRQTEIRHFKAYFDDTFGLGFGFMSGNAKYNNVIAFSANFASQAYGIFQYGLGLDDIGLYSALYQYGYVGFVIIVVMTAKASFSLIAARKRGDQYTGAAAIGLLMLAFMFSPISMNYFTLFYTGHIGGLLWFIASELDLSWKAEISSRAKSRAA